MVMDVDGTKLSSTLVVNDDGLNVDTIALERDTNCILGIADLAQVSFEFLYCMIQLLHLFFEITGRFTVCRGLLRDSCSFIHRTYITVYANKAETVGTFDQKASPVIVFF